MKTMRIITNGLENQGLPELTADEMADIQGGTAVEYAVQLAMILLLPIGEMLR